MIGKRIKTRSGVNPIVVQCFLDASNVLRDYCAISGYSKYIYRISLYKKDQFFLQAGSQPGIQQDPELIMSAPWFKERLTLTASQYTLILEDNPFPLGTINTPSFFPLVRPIQYRPGLKPEDAWVFLADRKSVV